MRHQASLATMVLTLVGAVERHFGTVRELFYLMSACLQLNVTMLLIKNQSR